MELCDNVGKKCISYSSYFRSQNVHLYKSSSQLSLKSSDCCDCFDSATVIFLLHLSLHIQCVRFHSHAVNLRQIESAECSHWVGKAINLEMETLSAVKN